MGALRYWIFLLLFVGQSCQPDEDISIDSVADFEEYLSDERDLQNIPALSVVVFDDAEILYEIHSGLANVDDRVSLRADHVFLLASISKVITATALLQLYDEGRFALDDAVADYLPFPVDVPNASGAVTFRMLLTHTSAIADGNALDDQYFYGRDSPVALKSFLESYLSSEGALYDADQNFHHFEPGADYEYSNVGTALIGLLVEEISGTNFNDYCKRKIFEPLGMAHTFWRLEEVTPYIVQPYRYDRGYEAIPHYTFTDYPNGGLRSNGRDLYKLLQALLNGGVSNGYRLLDGGTIDQMITPQIADLDGSVGWHLFEMNSSRGLWGHDGGEQGVATIMGFNPSTRVGAIVLANQGDADLDDILVEAYDFGIDR